MHEIYSSKPACLQSKNNLLSDLLLAGVSVQLELLQLRLMRLTSFFLEG